MSVNKSTLELYAQLFEELLEEFESRRGLVDGIDVGCEAEGEQESW